jgi:Uma2 family endonuclease
MAITAQPISSSDACSSDVPTEPIYRLSVAQYRAMAHAGILTEDDPVELLEGWLVRKMTKNPPHNVATGLVGDAIEARIPLGWHVAIQGSVTTADSEPEPDLAVIRGTRRDYLDRHPGPEDVALIAEVADTSLRRDRSTKKRLYARAGYPIYWIVNLAERQIEVYTEPSGPRKKPDYRQRRDYRLADEIPVVLDGDEIARIPVREMLP